MPGLFRCEAERRNWKLKIEDGVLETEKSTGRGAEAEEHPGEALSASSQAASVCVDRPAIRVTDLGKRYRAYSGPLDRLKEVLFGTAPNAREFVALDGVSFEVPRGCCLGVVGPNGAGKSTLLKILAGIVDPSTGSVEMNGRVASIIELGAGFHPDFTGRENVFLNAALTGRSDREAREKYEEIATFCELGTYLDMPVKTYSSGMFVRLAFAVAISAEPEILLVDEALAVGDAVFAHRCLGKIREMRDAGVTIVLVTHDTNTVAGLCDRALFIDRGRLAADGNPREVVHSYLLNVAERLTSLKQQGKMAAAFHQVGAQEEDTTAERRFGSFEARITDVFAEDAAGKPVEKIVSGEKLRLRMIVRFDKPVTNPVFGIMIRNRFGVEMFGTNTYLRRVETGSYAPGDVTEVIFEVPVLLGGGAYTACYAVHTQAGHFFDYRVDALVFEVLGVSETIGAVNLPVELSFRQVEHAAASDDAVLDHVYPDAPVRLEMNTGGERFLAGEWYDPHADGERPAARWMGREGTVFLRLQEGAAAVKITARTYHPEAAQKPVRIEVRLDGRALGGVDVGPDWNTCTLFLEKPAERERVTALRFTADQVWSPHDYAPQSTDERRLSVLVAEVWAE